MADFPFYEPERVLRRNLANNSSFEDGLNGWNITGGTGTTTTVFQTRMWGGSGPGDRMLQIDSGGTSSYMGMQSAQYIPVQPGKYLAFASLMANDASDNAGTRLEFYFYGSASTTVFENRTNSPFYPGRRAVLVAQVPSTADRVQLRMSMYSGGSQPIPEGKRAWMDGLVCCLANTQAEAEAAVASYFDGDTPDTVTIGYRWLPDGTSEEYLLAQNTEQLSGVMEISASTDARLGIVADVYSRSREKIQLELARVDSQLIAGERVELDAAAMTASPVVWHWRQITGPAVELEPREASMDFIAPDVDEDTPLRIAVYAASEDGRNRSDWHYFDLTIKPPIARFRATEGAFSPVSPKYVGYDRGKREVWNDVIPPSGFSPNPRHEVEILDLGIVPDDVQFTTGGPPERAAAGGIYVDLETGDIYRNFGAGYNETDDTTAAPRTNAWWVNPATGDILEWIED